MAKQISKWIFAILSSVKIHEITSGAGLLFQTYVKHFGPKSPKMVYVYCILRKYINTKYKHRDKIALDPTYPWQHGFYEQLRK